MITKSKKVINKVQFGLLSPDAIRKMSATRIITPDTYDEDGFPIEMGLMDPRLGVIEPGLRCKTCGQKVKECPGHFGHIELAMPVIHVGFAKTIYNILKATCRGCGKLLLTDDEVKKLREDYKKVLKMKNNTAAFAKEVVKRASKANKCPHCGREVLPVELDKPTTYREGGRKLTPAEVREWLEKVSEALGDDLRLLDINPEVARPEWMVLTVLPVPPVTTRPSITLETGERSEDDLTHKLVDIIRINQRLQENRDAGAPQLIVEDLWDLLQYHVTTYFDNQTSGIPPARHRSGRALKTLAQRLKGKEGRFRSNLSGKRVNFSARTVISPDPNISINEVGVPIEIAKELTVPIRVTQYNFEEMKELVKRGPEPVPPAGIMYLPGVNYVIRPDGRRIRVTPENAENVAERLEVGSIVERQLQDGDIVLFNRQPSLHRMSMMAHHAKILPYKTFRLNLAVCPPYNADFDGDEMNLHVLQSEEARAEAEILMKVQEHILSPRFGGAIIGAIHDHITGCFLLTYGNKVFSREDAMDILAAAGYKGEVKDKMTGKEIFSKILPPDLNLEYKAKLCTGSEEECRKHDAYVVIKNGKLIQGAIDEASIGAFKGKIIEYIARKKGSNAAREFIDKVTKLGIAAITKIGFTTGIDDEDIPEEAQMQIEEVLENAKKKIQDLIRAYKEGELEQIPGRSLEETLEMEIMRVTGKARDQTGEIAGRHLGLDNSAVIMARSGARGSMLNLSQMAGAVGQQAVRGERIHRGYHSRTLPHFKKGDLGAEAKGFVSSSYKKGLTPTEYFFHSMGGREGLVDTAVRTSRSGYMQRRLINALENIKLEEDGTVRQTTGEIIQFMYGEDGIDPTKSIRGKAVDADLIMKEVEK
ncbi:MAG: DNA-directed RNA polymerase subunit A' [Thermoplasmata archaeon]|nr:MAG: DNA-directed RNA polymerase subunit A' [Thermoplasmata archaeon]MCD6572791.1 DNA-directed RNA polymerase subunit A' [Thermoplasmata archaeon]